MTRRGETAPIGRRAAAVKAALVENGLVPAQMFDDVVHMAEDWKPENGANVVARAWTDPEFMARLRADATTACAELGYSGAQGEYIVALENTVMCHIAILGIGVSQSMKLRQTRIACVSLINTQLLHVVSCWWNQRTASH